MGGGGGGFWCRRLHMHTRWAPRWSLPPLRHRLLARQGCVGVRGGTASAAGRSHMFVDRRLWQVAAPAPRHLAHLAWVKRWRRAGGQARSRDRRSPSARRGLWPRAPHPPACAARQCTPSLAARAGRGGGRSAASNRRARRGSPSAARPQPGRSSPRHRWRRAGVREEGDAPRWGRDRLLHPLHLPRRAAAPGPGAGGHGAGRGRGRRRA